MDSDDSPLRSDAGSLPRNQPDPRTIAGSNPVPGAVYEPRPQRRFLRACLTVCIGLSISFRVTSITGDRAIILDAGILIFLTFITLEAQTMAILLDLTSPEREILRSVLAGRTNKEIAVEFRIAEKTVEFHLDQSIPRPAGARG